MDKDLLEVKGKVDEIAQTFEQFKEANDANLKKADAVSEEKAKKIADDMAKQMEELQKANAKIATLEKVASRPNLGGDVSDADKQKQLKKAFNESLNMFARKGAESVKSFLLEHKDLAVGVDPDGGYTVMPAQSNFVVSRVFETSPIRQLARSESISTDVLEMPIDDNDITLGGWVSETGTRDTTTTPQIGLKKIPVHEIFAQPLATSKILEDSSWDVESWLNQKLSDKFSRDENSAFVNGNGVGKPRGILTYSAWAVAGTYERDKIEQVNSGSAGAFTADGLITIQNSVKEFYQARAAWMMKRTSWGAVCKLKDAMGNYLVSFKTLDGSRMAGTPDLLGKPVYFADDFPVVAADALAAAYGDFNVGYTVVDRRGITLLRDPYTSKPYMKFYATKRVGGDVTNFESFKIQKLAA